MKSPLNLGILSNWNILIYFQLSKGPNFYKIPQEIWLTLSRFTGRQEKKDALVQTHVFSKESFLSLCSVVSNYNFIVNSVALCQYGSGDAQSHDYT